MQQFPPSSPPPKPKKMDMDNKYSACLFMNMEIKEVSVPRKPGSGIFRYLFARKERKLIEPVKQIDLYLAIQFNEQEEMPIPGGKISFGLKGGVLRLKLENGKIPLNSRELGGSFEVFIPKKNETKEVNEDKRSMGGSGGEKPVVQGSIEQKSGKEFTNEVQYTVAQVTTKGDERTPAWVFKLETGEPIITGLLKDAKLGRIEVQENPCTITATFEVSKRDVHITDASGVWLKNISFRDLDTPMRRVLDIWLLKKLLMPNLQPYLSQGKLTHEI
jgi:hypothetical protein